MSDRSTIMLALEHCSNALTFCGTCDGECHLHVACDAQAEARDVLASICNRPRIVVLCGSTRFHKQFDEANLRETLAGRIVLSIGCVWHSDQALGLTEEDKARLDALHLKKIDLADEVLVIDVDGYIGQSTANEIAYAKRHGKPIRYMSKESSDV